MARYSEAGRPLRVTTPLGPDKLFIIGFSGHEGVSQLFRFQLDLIAENTTDVAFDALLGKKFTVHLDLPAGGSRHFNGLCVRVSQGARDPRTTQFTAYRVELVPDLWKLTRKAQSRIFQQQAVPDILKQVLSEVSPSLEIKGTFLPRDYCVQYRETDFNFASRLMEEEGIYYYFKHSDGDHKLLIANTPQSHADLPGDSSITYESVLGGEREEDRIFDWEKTQELRSGKYTLWDHTFELPHKHLEAVKTIQDTVTLGKATHKLKVGGNDAWEIYDWPGEYAQRFDGISPGGGERSGDLDNIFKDNSRTVGIRMEEEALGSLLVQGASSCRQFSSGFKFTVQKHFSGEGGPYVLTNVVHSARSGGYFGGQAPELQYQNSFACIPLGLPFRPARVTPKPIAQGTQSAVVVGPAGEEIFTDKYARVKVQFHWDRQGKYDASSSCWLRVATPWAGKQWGMIHIPRIGQEVLVGFLEGDPDQPVVVGSLYNADMMPPGNLPGSKTKSGVASRSTLGGTIAEENIILFEDKKGEENVFIHAQKDQLIEVEHDETHEVGRDRSKSINRDETTNVARNRTETVRGNETISISGARTESVGKDESISIDGSRSEAVDKDETITVGGKRTESVAKEETVSIGKDRSHSVGQDDKLKVGREFSLVAEDSITLTAGSASIVLKKDGTIEIRGKDVTAKGSGKINIKADSDVVIKGSKVSAN
jgi:type VI secretion system secreted protein VgrG